MSLQLPSPVRRLLAWGVSALYLLPLLTAVGADLIHGARHLATEAQRVHRQAVALGLVHEAPRSPGRSGTPSTDYAPTLVHSHDGTTHSHGPLIAGLQRAADDDPAAGETPRTAGASLSVHLAANRTQPPAPRIAGWPSVPTLRLASAFGSVPELPPPRG